MTPGSRRRGGTGKPGAHLRAAACAFALGAAQGVAAQPAYECGDLETHAALPAVQGLEGIFFRLDPDLRMDQSITDHAIALIADLDRALAARGTTLVLLPVPSRALVLSDRLPPMAGHLGYDAGVARSVHLDTMRRLEAAGLAVADPLPALRDAALRGEEVLFPTDPRPTPGGARLMAQAVADLLAAHPTPAALPRAGIASVATGAAADLPSPMRARLQLACRDPLPAPRSESHTTTGATFSGA